MGKILIAYWSGTGHTEAMMSAIADGIKEAGAEVDIMGPGEYDAAQAAAYDKLVLGCPAMGDEQLEEDDFEPFFSALESKLSGKKVGQLLDDGLAIKASSDVNVDQVCKEWGKRVVAF